MKTFVSIDPATGKKLKSYRGHTRPQIEQTAQRAHAAFSSWSRCKPGIRARHLRSLAKTLRADKVTWANLITAEVGKPITQSLAEIEKCAVVCEFYASHGAAFLADEKPMGAPAHASVRHEPLGVILAVMPWNFPFWQLFRAAAPALMAGNALLLKHSSNVSGCALAIARAFTRAGVPKGLMETLLIDNPTTEKLIADPRIRGVTLTGSTRAGCRIASLAGIAMKPCVFELGGSDPYIVLADADLAKAAEICAQARLVNSGQSCVCAKRFIVVRSVEKTFTELFLARIAARKIGAPTAPSTEVGPLAREDLRATLHEQVMRSVRRGAKILTGGFIPPGPGYFYPPTVLSQVRPGMPAYDEELFGPVASIISVRDDAEAIHVANDSIYGLGAALFTRSAKKIEMLVPQIEAGAVFINDFVKSDPALPFGGVKKSGYGRELGRHGLLAFVNVKTVVGH